MEKTITPLSAVERTVVTLEGLGTEAWSCIRRIFASAAAIASAPVRSARRNIRRSAFGSRGKMDKCAYCAGEPEAPGSVEEY